MLSGTGAVFGFRQCGCRLRSNDLDGEEVLESVREDREENEPASDRHQYPSTPALDRRCRGLESFDGGFLSDRDADGGSENQCDQGGSRYRVGDECGAETAGGECLYGQTGRDWAGSTKPGGEVREAEQQVSGSWSAPS